MEAVKPMSKVTFNGIHIDLSDVSLIGQLVKRENKWFAPVVWLATGTSINLQMGKSAEDYAIIISDAELTMEKEAKDNYDRLVELWKACN